MKKTILSLIATAITFYAFADGVIQNNGLQSGISTFSSSTSLLITNVFPVPYTTMPVVTLNSTSTNNYPWTVSAVSLTNFVLTVSSGTTTNNSIIWNSYAGYPRCQFGTNAVTGGTLLTNVFVPPYAYPPSVEASGSAAGTNNIFTMTVTATQMVITSQASQNISWYALGISFSPGISPVTY